MKQKSSEPRPALSYYGLEMSGTRGVRECGDLLMQRQELAEQQCYPHHAALAAERRRMLQELRLPRASLSLAEATRRYREWGCEAKAIALERTQPPLVLLAPGCGLRRDIAAERSVRALL